MYASVGPWPPQRNGIADYAEEIARWTPHRLLVVTETAGPRAGLPNCRFADAASGWPRGMPAVYHIGNNADHAFLVSLFLRRPGVVVLHDPVLHFLATCADALLPGFFAAQLRAEHPAIAARLIALWRHDGMKRRLDHRETRMLHWLAQAPAIVVHSRYAARLVMVALPDLPVHVVPHFAYPPPLGWDGLQRARPALRAQWLGVDEATARTMLLVSVPGFASPRAGTAAILRAVAALPDGDRRRVIVLASDAAALQTLPPRVAARVSGCLRALPYLGAVALTEMLLASDLVMAPRHPSLGESSGIVARALGLGCAVVVTDAGAASELPASTCAKLPDRPDPDAAARAVMARALADPAALGAQRRAAFGYAATLAHPREVAARLSSLAVA